MTAGAVALALIVAAQQPVRAQPATSAPPAGMVRFASLALPDAQLRAVAASPEVRTARANVDAARAAYDQARGTYGLSATAGYAEAPQGAPGGTIAQRLTTYGAQITLGDIAAYSPLVAQAAAALRASQTDEIAAERAERVKVVGLYYAALRARSVSAARTGALGSAGAFLDAAQKRFAAGDAARIDVVRAQLAQARAQADLARARADDANADDALAREAGIAPSALAGAGTEPVASAQIPAPDDAVTAALARRADVRSADDNVRAAQAAVRAAERGVLPPVTLNAGYERGVDSGFAVAGPTVGAQIAIPIGGALGAKVRGQRALLDVATAKRDAVTRQIAVEVGAASRSASAAVDAEHATAAGLDAARAELDAATLGYRNGVSTSLDLSSARNAYVQAEIDELSALYDRLQAQATLQLEVSE